MDKNKMREPIETEYSKFVALIGAYEKILHPDIFMPIMKQLNACYEESKREAYAKAKISDDALYIEKKMNELKESNCRNISKTSRDFYIKCLYKEFLKMFLDAKPRNNI